MPVLTILQTGRITGAGVRCWIENFLTPTPAKWQDGGRGVVLMENSARTLTWQQLRSSKAVSLRDVAERAARRRFVAKGLVLFALGAAPWVGILWLVGII